MAHAAVISSWAITGARATLTWCRTRTAEATSDRAVRTSDGYALFDDRGCYLGKIATQEHPAFGRGANTVLLRRDGG